MTRERLRFELEQVLREDPAAAVQRERAAFDQMAAPFEQRIVLFGAGNLGRTVLQGLRRHGTEPLAFCDNAQSRWGTQIDGVPVLAPAEAAANYARSAAFVVAIFNPLCSYVSIRQQLVGLGCDRVLSFLPLFWKYPDDFLPYVSIGLPHEILLHGQEVVNAFDLMGDLASCAEYVAQTRWRILQDFDGLPPSVGEPPYLPRDPFQLSSEEVFVDCGAFDGDTIRILLAEKARFQRIFALEPDPHNLAKLRACLDGLPATIREKIVALPVAASSHRGTLRFEATGSVGSKISDQGGAEVQCVSLDEEFATRGPTYVKMDIEGAELEALRGGRRLLARGDAIWAVCVYHKPEDLWEIPLYMNSQSDEYRFFLRKYIGEIWDTVCFAVPEHRLLQPASAGPGTSGDADGRQ